MKNKALDRETVFELLQTQLTHYLMIEKYGFRAEKYADSPEYITISKSEIKADLEALFGEDNKQIIEALYWVLNDAVSCFEPVGWDE
tara:strand:+ start:305 stop:565 length:261 start_codon:yes stop_codon:yes gene_type:complete